MPRKPVVAADPEDPETVASPPANSGDLDAATEASLVASRALLGVVAVSMEPVLDKVTLPQFRILVLLDALGSSRSGEIAKRLGVHQSTFSRTADRLVLAGLVRRLPSPHSRREVLVTLTAKGARLVASVMQRRRRLLRQILADLPTSRRQQIIDGFTLFAEAADEPSYSTRASALGA